MLYIYNVRVTYFSTKSCQVRGSDRPGEGSHIFPLGLTVANPCLKQNFTRLLTQCINSLLSDVRLTDIAFSVMSCVRVLVSLYWQPEPYARADR